MPLNLNYRPLGSAKGLQVKTKEQHILWYPLFIRLIPFVITCLLIEPFQKMFPYYKHLRTDVYKRQRLNNGYPSLDPLALQASVPEVPPSRVNVGEYDRLFLQGGGPREN